MRTRTDDIRRWFAAAAVLLAAGACSGSECVSGPLCDGGGGGGGGGGSTPTVASIDLTSPLDSLIAVGRTIQITATPRDASGAAVTSATVSWASSAPAAVTVTSSGLITGVGPGTATITATAGSQTATLTFRSVDSDLAGISVTLQDPMATALVAGLAAATSTTVNTALGECTATSAAGDLNGLDACLDQIDAVGGSGGDDTAKLAVLRLFIDHARRLLNLGR